PCNSCASPPACRNAETPSRRFQKKNRPPNNSGAGSQYAHSVQSPRAECTNRTGSVDGLRLHYILLDRLVGTRQVGNLDPARLERLGDFAGEVDMQHPVRMGSTGHNDMIRQMEPALKGAGRDAAV